MIANNDDFGRYIKEEVESRWSDKDELKNASTIRTLNLDTEEYNGGGLPIIVEGRRIYVDNSDTHSIIFGSTGSKKTRLFAMPLLNILALAGESFIVTDPKGELYEKTAGLVESKGYKTIVLNFRDLPKSDLWNPLTIPYELYHSGRTEEAIALVNDLISALAEDQRATTKERYWIDMAVGQALAMLLFFIDTTKPEQCNMFNFASFFTNNCSPEKTTKIAGGEFEKWTSEGLTNIKYPSKITPGSIADINFQSTLSNAPSEKTFSSVSSSVSVMLNPFILRKTLGQVMSKSSFDIRSIGTKKTAIYLIVPDEKTTFHMLVTMFIKQVYETMIDVAQTQPNRQLPVRLNFVLDEFANLPAIPDMASMISAARSRNMRFFLMLQGMRQLNQKYGLAADTIKGNCDNWVYLSSREYELISEFSVLCGNKSNNKPLINITQLQQLKKEWEYSEALIRHGRNHPYVAWLPDIDQYKFPVLAPNKRKHIKLPELVRYEVEKILAEIEQKKRPLPFSKEVHGKDTFYSDTNDPKNKKKDDDLFDW